MLADKVAPDWEKAKDATVLVVNIFVIAGFLFLLARSLKGCEQLNGVGNQCSGWNDANYHYDDGEPVVFLNCKLSNDKLCEGCTGCSFQKNGMGYCVEPLYACVTKQDGKFLIIIEKWQKKNYQNVYQTK